ncbi:unnamed protein product [Linum trigynum]|uniref:DUF4283 domain-containing protein n=1 Tax=Linum trigynum TaxID=586398 RepID=A0AAV2CZQ4_9ROSI
MTAAKRPTSPAVAGKPPEVSSGQRRPAEASSTPDGKSARETVQPKKKVRALNFEGEAVDVEDLTAEEMDTEHEGNAPKASWQAKKGMSFSDILQQDHWYVAESDSEDVLEREKEEDDEIDDEKEDPKCPTIPFTATEKTRWRREWRSALVVKGLGRRVSYIPLARRLNAIWARHGDLQISDMRNGCFLVRFCNQKDYEWATLGGPWLLGDTYLTVHRWFKGFNPWKTVVTSTMVWAQLPELPIEFINKEVVMKIAGWLGRPVRVDRATELGARGNYARVCVEVDLTQPLLSQFKIEGVTYLVQYEGLDDLCTCCGTYGKRAGTCQCAKLASAMEVEGNKEVEPEGRVDPTQGQTYGDWMVVKRRGRGYDRGKEEGKEKKKEEISMNRFQKLQRETTQVENREDEKESDKGNEGGGEESVGQDGPELRDQPHAVTHAAQVPTGVQA